MATTLTDFSGETDNSKCISETGRCAGQRRAEPGAGGHLNQVLAGRQKAAGVRQDRRRNAPQRQFLGEARVHRLVEALTT